MLTGFVGVVLMLRPSLQNQAFADLVGLLSGMTAAFAYMVGLSRLGEPESRTVFFTLPWAHAGRVVCAMVSLASALAGLPRPVAAAYRRFGGWRTAVHDALTPEPKPRAARWWWPICRYSGIVFAAICSVVFVQ